MSAPAIVRTDHVNHWYGRVVALNDVSLDIGGGITGLLGPNGAGKTSLLRMVAGILRPSAGRVEVLGDEPWDNPRLNLRVGYCPEHDGFPEWMTGRTFVRTLLGLRGFGRSEAAGMAEAALERVALTGAADRRAGTYSRGMRQRLKLAQAVAYPSELLVLDEPLTGTDPLVRRELIALIKSFAAEGRHVIVSSHVLHEIEALTRQIVLIHRGRLVAFGDREEIRSLIDRHQHAVTIRTPHARPLAAALVSGADVAEVAVGDGELMVRTRAPAALYRRLPQVVVDTGADVTEVDSPDDSLEAVFRYLTER